MNLRQINSDSATTRRVTRHPEKKVPAQDSRSKALAFARRIPPPKKVLKDEVKPHERRRAGAVGEGSRDEAWSRPRELTELEALEALHDDMRRKVQAARTSF